MNFICILCVRTNSKCNNKNISTQHTGWYEDNWYEVNLEAENITCTREQMKMAAEGHLTTEAIMWNQNVDEKTISGMSSGDFRYAHLHTPVLTKKKYFFSIESNFSYSNSFYFSSSHLFPHIKSPQMQIEKWIFCVCASKTIHFD